MRKQIKKLIVVISLTFLIWAWAYLADEDVTKQTVTLDISTTTSKEILVTFNVPTPISYELNLKGPAAKVAELKKKLQSDDPEEKERLNFIWDVEHEKKTHLSRYSLDVIEFIKNSDKMKTLGLTAEPVKIDPIEVKIEKLVKKTLSIQVLDKDGATLKTKTIVPADTVEMFVHSDWTDDMLRAYVTLPDPQIDKARNEGVFGQPYVTLNNGIERQAGRHKITLSPTAEALANKPYSLRIGFIEGKALLGKYKIELTNEKELTSATDIVATNDAHAAFEKMQYQLLVEVRDNDAIETEITRQVIYNFPSEHVRKGEIKLNEEPRTAKFKLVPIQSP